MLNTLKQLFQVTEVNGNQHHGAIAFSESTQQALGATVDQTDETFELSEQELQAIAGGGSRVRQYNGLEL